jgi:putative phage-type endonuclease
MRDSSIGVGDRVGYLGGSDAASVCGLNPWKTTFQLYLEKTGESEPDYLEDNEGVYWGNVLEAIVAREYTRRTERKVRRVNALIRDAFAPHLAVHIDRDILKSKGILECKTAGLRVAKHWGEAGTSDIAEYYLPQAQHTLMVTQADFVDVALLLGGNEFRLYRVDRDDEYIGLLREVEQRFWQRVVNRDPPDPETIADAKLAWPTGTGVVEADSFAYEAAEKLEHLIGRIKNMEGMADAQRLKIMAAMGDDGDVLTHDERTIATWKQQKGKTTVDAKALKSDYPEAYEATKKTGSPFRVFRPKKIGD